MSSKIYSKRYQIFLKKLRSARKNAGMTQKQAAHALLKPQSFISKCENGERRVDVIDLIDFANLYQKPIVFFYEGVNGNE